MLVTGAQGFLGRNVVSSWLGSRPSIRILGVGRSARLDETFTYDLRWGAHRVRAPLPPELRDVASDPRYAYEAVDLCDPDAVAAVLRTFSPDVIVHGASALRDDPWQALFRSNVQSAITIAEALPASPVPSSRLVLVSSGSVYGATDPAHLPIGEAEPCVPLDLYAASKVAAEDVARILAFEHDVPLVRARLFNLLGPGLQDRHFAASLAGQIAATRRGISAEPLQVGRLDTTRDFIDVRDASEALLVLAERATPGPDSVFNVASGLETPIQTVFDHLLRLGEIDPDRVEREREVPPRPAEIARSYADVRRASGLGFQTAIDLADSLADMLTYYETSVAVAGR